MNIARLVFALLVLIAASCREAPATDLAKPEAFALQLPFEPAPGGSLQRFNLPPEALIAVRRADLGDIRMFDSQGKLVPLALIGRIPDEPRRSISVPVYPVVGPIGALDTSGLSIRIEGNNVARVVTVHSSSSSAGEAASEAVLLDTRTLREPATGIALDIDIPPSQPVPLILLTSANLKDWEPLAEKTLFRPVDGSPLLGGGTVVLPGVGLGDRYVGISWRRTAGVVLRGATVITSTSVPAARTEVAASGVPLVDAHELRFNLPGLARLAAIRLTEAASDGVIPATLYGRNDPEDPWTLLSATTLRQGAGANLLDLSGSPMTSYRILADRRTAGFSAPPRLELLLNPVEMLVALSGLPPYRLAVGQAAAPATYLTLTEIAPRLSPLKLATLPHGTIAIPRGPPLIVELKSGASDSSFDLRKLILWAALLLGTMVLGFAALHLMRAMPPRANPKDE